MINLKKKLWVIYLDISFQSFAEQHFNQLKINAFELLLMYFL